MKTKDKITNYTVSEIIDICKGTSYTCKDCLFVLPDDDCLFNYAPSEWCEVYELDIAQRNPAAGLRSKIEVIDDIFEQIDNYVDGIGEFPNFKDAKDNESFGLVNRYGTK